MVVDIDISLLGHSVHHLIVQVPGGGGEEERKGEGGKGEGRGEHITLHVELQWGGGGSLCSST